MELTKFLFKLSDSCTTLLVLILCVDKSLYSLGFLLGIEFPRNSQKVACKSHCLSNEAYLWLWTA